MSDFNEIIHSKKAYEDFQTAKQRKKKSLIQGIMRILAEYTEKISDRNTGNKNIASF